MIPALSRRTILEAVAAAAVVLPVVRPGSAYASLDIQRDTMDAWADTIVPGQKRTPNELMIAGAAPGPGAVQAGSWAMYTDPDVGLAPVIPAVVALINTEATAYAATHGRLLDLKLAPPFVSLKFRDRTQVAEKLLQGEGPVQLLWYAVAAMPMLAFHTAGHMDTATAVRQGHPGLAWLGFPQPDADGIWRFDEFSYGRRLARRHPNTTAKGHPR